MRPVASPQVPSVIALSVSSSIFVSSAAVGGRLALPIARSRMLLCGARWMTLVPTPPSSSALKNAPASTGPDPQLPVTTVVHPCVV